MSRTVQSTENTTGNSTEPLPEGDEQGDSEQMLSTGLLGEADPHPSAHPLGFLRMLLRSDFLEEDKLSWLWQAWKGVSTPPSRWSK